MTTSLSQTNLKAQSAIILRKLGNIVSFGGRFRTPQSILRRCFRHAHGTVHISDFDGDLEVELRLSEHMQRRIFWTGYYNLNMVPLLDKLLKPGMTVIDIGANIGEITMVSAKRVGASGRVVSFEPVDGIVHDLIYNIQRNNLTQVHVVQSGLSDVARHNVPIYDSYGSGTSDDENAGRGSLYGDGSGNKPLQNISITTLDLWATEHPLQRIDLIKIDIEGAELPCLRGAAATLAKFHPMLIIEVQDESATAAGYRAKDILQFLASFGYGFMTIGNHGKLTPVDAAHLTSFQNVFCKVQEGKKSSKGA